MSERSLQFIAIGSAFLYNSWVQSAQKFSSWRPGLILQLRSRLLSMSKVCQVTGKGPMSGNNVSHANNKTRRRFLPNLQVHRLWVESENRFVSLRISPAGLRTIDKKGIDAVLADLRAKGEKI